MRLRRQALGPVKGEIQDMVNAAKHERFETLCARTWECWRKNTGNPSVGGHADEDADNTAGNEQRHASTMHSSFAGTGSGPNTGFRSPASMTSTQKSNANFATRIPEDIATEMHTVEADIAAMKRLLTDMRGNAAAVICHQIREAEKTGGRAMAKDAMEDGLQKLNFLVNEDFAKSTMKEMQKSAPQGKFSF